MFIAGVFYLVAAIAATSFVVTVGKSDEQRIAYEKELCKVRCEPKPSKYDIIKYEHGKCYCVLDDGSLREKQTNPIQ